MFRYLSIFLFFCVKSHCSFLTLNRMWLFWTTVHQVWQQTPFHPISVMKKHGFGHFVGIDGSEAMLEMARESGLYQDMKHSLLGEEPLPVHWAASFDVIVIVGALSVGQVPVCMVRQLCKSAKPGGYICMTTRSNQDNVEYKAALESELRQMEEEGLWTRVEVTEVKDWERAVSEQEDGYISGAVYLYKKLRA
ncbi:methyltransferase-like protein 27 isoform X3 [Embiotoca jacksoni]|uniref:methyltransferase-like protein 27 isoform X3 n=1 Tax=Embiotoca jacksoni TaxID=100190 RepID=UPI0037043BB3